MRCLCTERQKYNQSTRDIKQRNSDYIKAMWENHTKLLYFLCKFAWPLRKKNFFWSSKKISPKNVATELEGGGGTKISNETTVISNINMTTFYALFYEHFVLFSFSWSQKIVSPFLYCILYLDCVHKFGPDRATWSKQVHSQRSKAL